MGYFTEAGVDVTGKIWKSGVTADLEYVMINVDITLASVHSVFDPAEAFNSQFYFKLPQSVKNIPDLKTATTGAASTTTAAAASGTGGAAATAVGTTTAASNTGTAVATSSAGRAGSTGGTSTGGTTSSTATAASSTCGSMASGTSVMLIPGTPAQPGAITVTGVGTNSNNSWDL